MPTGPEVSIMIARCVWGRALQLAHLKQGLVPHTFGRWDVRQIPIRPIPFIEYNMAALLCLIIYHQENYFYFLFNVVRVKTNVHLQRLISTQQIFCEVFVHYSILYIKVFLQQQKTKEQFKECIVTKSIEYLIIGRTGWLHGVGG